MRDPSLDLPTGLPIDHGLGRYEYISGTSRKFYEVMHIGYDADGNNLFRAQWGRIGVTSPQGMTLGYTAALEKIRAKKAKGYVYVPGSFRSFAEKKKVGLQAIVDQIRPKGELPEAPPAPVDSSVGSSRPRM